MVFRRFSASALTRDISRGYLSAMFRALWRLARRHEEWDLAFRSRHAQLTPAERGCSLRRLWKGREVALPVDPGQRAPWSPVCPTRRGNDGLDGSRHARRAFAPCCRRLSYTMNAHPHRHRCHDVDAQFGTPSAGSVSCAQRRPSAHSYSRRRLAGNCAFRCSIVSKVGRAPALPGLQGPLDSATGTIGTTPNRRAVGNLVDGSGSTVPEKGERR